MSGPGSGSGPRTVYQARLAAERPCKLCKDKTLPLPVALSLALGKGLKGRSAADRKKLNQPTVLIRARHASVACCWFSGSIYLDDSPSEPAFWILEKTAKNWMLRLKRIKDNAKWADKWLPTEELSGYDSKADKCSYIKKLKLNKFHPNKYWQGSVTIEPV